MAKTADEIRINRIVDRVYKAIDKLVHTERKQPNGPEQEKEPFMLSCPLSMPIPPNNWVYPTKSSYTQKAAIKNSIMPVVHLRLSINITRSIQ